MPDRKQLKAAAWVTAASPGSPGTGPHAAGPVTAAGLAGQLAEHCKPAALQTFVTIIRDL